MPKDPVGQPDVLDKGNMDNSKKPRSYPVGTSLTTLAHEDLPKESKVSVNTENILYEGIVQKQLFENAEQARVFSEIGDWFEIIKEAIPKMGILICNRYDDPELYTRNVGTKPPEAIQKLVDAIIEDAIKDPKNSGKPFVKVLLERTGRKYTNPDDAVYHVDTKQIQWDENGNRIGYDDRPGPDKYMVFIHRPGTLVIKRELDDELSNWEQNGIALQYYVDPTTGETFMKGSTERPDVLQLQEGEIYRVQVGNLIHSPPLHEDGLLITVSLIDEMTKNTPIPVYLNGETHVDTEVESTPAELWGQCETLKEELNNAEGKLDKKLVDTVVEMTDFVNTLPLPDSKKDRSYSVWQIRTINAQGEPVTIEIQGGVFFKVRDEAGNTVSKTAVLNLNKFPNGDKTIRTSIATSYVVPEDEGFKNFGPFEPESGYSNSNFGGAGYGVVSMRRMGTTSPLQRLRNAPSTSTDPVGEVPKTTPPRKDPISHLSEITQMAKAGTVFTT